MGRKIKLDEAKFLANNTTYKEEVRRDKGLAQIIEFSWP